MIENQTFVKAVGYYALAETLDWERRGFVILRQFLHDDPVAASCLLGCDGQSAGAAEIRAINSGWAAAG